MEKLTLKQVPCLTDNCCYSTAEIQGDFALTFPNAECHYLFSVCNEQLIHEHIWLNLKKFQQSPLCNDSLLSLLLC